MPFPQHCAENEDWKIGIANNLQTGTYQAVSEVARENQ
jgi:hypothetical protein